MKEPLYADDSCFGTSPTMSAGQMEPGHLKWEEKNLFVVSAEEEKRQVTLIRRVSCLTSYNGVSFL